MSLGVLARFPLPAREKRRRQITPHTSVGVLRKFRTLPGIPLDPKVDRIIKPLLGVYKKGNTQKKQPKILLGGSE